MDQDKVSAITNWFMPTTVKDLQFADRWHGPNYEPGDLRVMQGSSSCPTDILADSRSSKE